MNCSEDTSTRIRNDGIYLLLIYWGNILIPFFFIAMVTVDDTVVNMAVRLYGEVQDMIAASCKTRRGDRGRGVDYAILKSLYRLIRRRQQFRANIPKWYGKISWFYGVPTNTLLKHCLESAG
ncbi:MAG: hypothetical protein ACLU4N_13805 [Butyricimonas faecihominis]